MLTRLIHDALGVRFEAPMEELEMGFWQALVRTRPMPRAREMLEACHRFGMAMGVVSNSSFSAPVIRSELAKHGLAERLAFVMVSADYVVRKPSVLLFETAAARIGVTPSDIWFIGDRLDTDVAGANSAGMTSVWFQPAPERVSDEPHLVVRSWDAFVEAIAKATR